MTLSLHTLSEWRRQEQDGPVIARPPPLVDIKTLLDRLMQEAGPDPVSWPVDCEVFAAKEMLEDIFRIRREKLARACEMNPDDATLPEWKSLLPFEQNVWFHLIEGYRMLDYATKQVVRKGEWNGKWRPDKPGRED